MINKQNRPPLVSLSDAFVQGKLAASPGATFEGWKKLPGPERVIAGRWSDGTTVYRQRTKAWISGGGESEHEG